MVEAEKDGTVLVTVDEIHYDEQALIKKKRLKTGIQSENSRKHFVRHLLVHSFRKIAHVQNYNFHLYDY